MAKYDIFYETTTLWKEICLIENNETMAQWGSMVTFITNIFSQKMVIFIVFGKATS